MICQNCQRRQAGRWRSGRLCAVCFSDLDVRAQYPSKAKPEPTEAELEATIAEQRRCLPAWWPADGERDTEE